MEQQLSRNDGAEVARPSGWGGGDAVTVSAVASRRREDDWREGVERAVVYVTAVGEVKTSSGSVC